MRVVNTSIVRDSRLAARGSTSDPDSGFESHRGRESQSPIASRPQRIAIASRDRGSGSAQRESHASPLRPPDPVPLHRQNFFRPFGQRIGRIEELIGVMSDPEEPLLQLAYRHSGSATPAGAVDHLLVGQHRVTARAPVDVRAPPVREVAFQHLQEYPLVPAVVIRQARGDLALPRVADAQTLELPFHVGDVFERPGLGMRLVLDSRVLGGQPEGVPTERVQDVEAAHALHARDDVADHVVADVSDVGVPRRVREHLEAVELRLVGILSDLEGAAVAPPLLPLLLDCLGFVVRHDLLIISHARSPSAPPAPPRAHARRVPWSRGAGRTMKSRRAIATVRPKTRPGNRQERRGRSLLR